MREQTTALRFYVGEQREVIRQLLEKVERHVPEKFAAGSEPASKAIRNLKQVLSRQVEALSVHLQLNGGKELDETKFQDLGSSISVYLAGLYGSLEQKKLSRVIQEDLASLDIARSTYIMLGAAGDALQHCATVALADNLMNDLVPVASALSKALPAAVADELALPQF